MPNIAAIASNGAICVIRLSGEKSLFAIKTLSKRQDFTPQKAQFSPIFYEDGELLDEALILYFKGPRSFTGEDLAEIHAHGGRGVASAILDRLFSLGFRAALPGEFSKRAFLNGKMSLDKALAINELIATKSQKQAKLVAKNLKNDLLELMKELRKDLFITLAHIEVAIDYADDDLPAELEENSLLNLRKNAELLEKILKRSEKKRGLIQGFALAIIGRANVGKSSLLNALLSQERAIVSDIEGTTRDSVEELINLGGQVLRIIDTAGLRATLDEIEKLGIKRSKKAAKEADFIIALFDASCELKEADYEVIDFAQALGKEVLYVLNKSDLALTMDEKTLKAFPKKPLLISSKTQDIKELELAIAAMFEDESEGDLILASSELARELEKSLEHIQDALLHLQNNSLELAAFCINQALSKSSIFEAKPEYDELLDEIFSRFCLGK